MPTTKPNPRYNVISLRVTDEEKKQIERVMMREKSPSVSGLLRGVIVSWLGVVR